MNNEYYKKVTIWLFIIVMAFPVISFQVFKCFLEVENNENRTLAERPEFNLENYSEFPKEYETYFTDHLPYKNELVKFYQKMNFLLFKELPTEKVVLGKENWLFYLGEPGEDPIADYQGTNLFTEDELLTIKNNLETVEAYFESRNIDFVLMLAPNKEQIYDEYMSDVYKIVNKEKRYDALAKYIKKNTNIKIVDPKEELLKEKKIYPVYYKFDSHWNKLGGFVAAQQLLEATGNERVFLSDVCIEEYDQVAEDLIGITNLPQYFTDDKEYVIEGYKEEVTANLVNESDDKFLQDYTSDSNNDKKIFVIRDSFGATLQNYLPQNFREVTFLHRNSYHINFINDREPDIVVYEIVERNLDLLKNYGLGILPD